MKLRSGAFFTEWNSARLRGIGQAVLRGADRIAGMRAVTPLPGDAYRIHYDEGQNDNFVATVEVADLGDVVAARHSANSQGDVRIVVSSRATPHAVPLLVAAALADVVADRSNGEPLMNVRDRMAAAQLLACDYLLRRDPSLRSVRAQLRTLIREMGLDPSDTSRSADPTVLPARVQAVVKQHTVTPDGQARTESYLLKAIIAEMPVGVIVMVLALTTSAVMTTPVLSVGAGAVVVAASVGRALAHALRDRWVALREDAATDEYIAARDRTLKDDAKTNESLEILRATVSALHPDNAFGEHVVATPDDGTRADVREHQLRRVYGLRRVEGMLGGFAGIGLVLVAAQVVPLGSLVIPIAGIVLSLTAQTAFGPFVDAYKRRLIVEWKTDRKNAQLTKLNELLSGRNREAVTRAANFVAEVREELEKSVDEVALPSLWAWTYSDGAVAQVARIGQPRKSRPDGDPNVVAEALTLWLEYAGFRLVLAAALTAWSRSTGRSVYAAGQAARNELKAYDAATDAELDNATLEAVLADIRGEPAPPAPGLTPRADDADRPSGLPSWKWYALPAATGLLAVAVATAMGAALGLGHLPWFYLVGALGPVTDARADWRTTKKELEALTAKADIDRAATAGGRTTREEAFAAFWQDVRGNPERHRGRVDDPSANEILAARDAAYWALVDQVRALADNPATRDTPPVELAETYRDRVVALHDIDSKVGKWVRYRDLANRGQERAERVARDALILAIRTYNEIPGVANPIPAARLFDGVHAGNAGGNPFAGQLPVLPAGVNGQVAAVTLDRHFRHPGVPYAAPPDLTTHADHTAWDDRVAAAAGVAGSRFQPVGTFNDIVELLTELGEGSRAIVHVRQKDDNGVAVSGHLVNAVDIGGTVHFLDARSGGLADIAALAGNVAATGPAARTPGRALFGGLSLLITEDNGGRMAERLLVGMGRDARALVSAAARDAGQRVGAVARDGVAGSLLTDRAAPGLTEPASPHSLSGGLSRIAAVINPGRHLPQPANPAAPDPLPTFRAFSDQWDEEELPKPDDTNLEMAATLAELAVVLLREVGEEDVTGTPEFRRLSDLLARPDASFADLRDAMVALVEVLLADQRGAGSFPRTDKAHDTGS